jgi:phytoene dehydrogenase-like protein
MSHREKLTNTRGIVENMGRCAAYDAVVIGSGPNGLAAAVALAQEGRSVVVYEAKDTIGGGCRSQALTLPGFTHDVCSAIHPLGYVSPFFRTLPLARYGLEWIHPPAPLAHPLDDGTAVVLERSLYDTAQTLGCDADRYITCMMPLVQDWDALVEALLGPLRIRSLLPHTLALTPFGLAAIRSARSFANHSFREQRARALFAGLSAHSMLPLEAVMSAAPGLMLGVIGHAAGWPLPRGGSQRIVEALAAYLRDLGGEIITGHEITSLAELPAARAVVCDVTARQLLRIAGQALPAGYRRCLERFRYGPGLFKIDYALAGPIPWKARSCLRAGTVHLGGTLEEIALSEREVWQGKNPTRPYVLVAQQSLFDDTRAPAGKHTAWVYCHVPSGSTFDMTERIEAQIERFAPGFRDLVLACHSTNASDLEQYNANYVGGDINGGVLDIRQLYTRPTLRLDPYTTPDKRIFICSSSTPPGGGVHGLCGYFAAHAVMRSHSLSMPSSIV